MQPKYRYTIENFELTKDQCHILFEAKKLLADMRDWLDTSNCPYDNDLAEVIDEALKGLTAANARLNVNTRLEED